MTAQLQIGLGLWTMRATAAYPGSPPQLYADLREDARRVERLGLHSLWVAEHHFWYDGWCPSPLTAAGSVLGATERLHVGTGIHLLPMADRDRAARQLRWLHRLSGGRLEHGVGLGYREAEYDGFGLSRKVRGKRMDAALDLLAEADGPRIWVGGMAGKALERAGRRGLGVMLPATLDRDQIVQAIEHVRNEAADAGKSVRIGMMKYTWPTDGSDAGRRRASEALDAWTREYTGSWFELRGRPGFESPDLLQKQVDRAVRTALIGPPEQIAAQLADYAELGVEMVVAHLLGDGRRRDRHAAMETIAADVAPALTAVGA